MDYIPRSETAFLDWATALVDYAAGHLADFKLEPSDLAPVQALLADYRAKFTAAADPNHGKVDVLGKKHGEERVQSGASPLCKGAPCL